MMNNEKIIKILQSDAVEFITRWNLLLEGVVIKPKEIEIYYYKEGVFEDNSVHRNELQEMNANHFYIHRMGLRQSDKYKGRNYAGLDFVLSNEKGLYYSYLIRSAVVNNTLVVGPNKVLNAIVAETNLTMKEIESKEIEKIPCDTVCDVLYSTRINLGKTVSIDYLQLKLRFVLCDELYAQAKYQAKEKMVVDYLYDKFDQQDILREEAIIFAKQKLGYIPSSIRLLCS